MKGQTVGGKWKGGRERERESEKVYIDWGFPLF